MLARQAMPTCEVTETADAVALLAALQTGRHFDLLALEPALPGLAGAALLAETRRLRPEVPVLVLAADESPQAVVAALDAGAQAYLFKSGPELPLFMALREAMARRALLPPAAATAAPPVRMPSLGLSPRQGDVLRCLMRGLTAKQIGRALGISEGTVKTHTVAVFHALNVNSRTQAVVEAYRRGMLAEP